MINALVALLLFSSAAPLTLSSVVIHFTSSGGVCTNACAFHGYDYTWCAQSGGNGKKWDYCSLEPGLEATGQRCGTRCILWGGTYRFCYLINGSWNYCGLLGQQELLQYSQDNNICVDVCRASNGSFQCNTQNGIERCSPFRDVTPVGLPCHSYYRCAKYGHSVYRCHIDDSKGLWDQCGRKSMDPCVWFYNSSDTDSFLDSSTEMCKLSNYQKEGQVIFRRVKRKYVYPGYFASEEFKDAIHLIDKIDSITSLPDMAKVHLSRQENVICKGVNYTNVELKLDVTNITSVPVAHVLFPDTLQSVEILRLAFYTSLHSTYYHPAYIIVVSLGEAMLCSIRQMAYLTDQ